MTQATTDAKGILANLTLPELIVKILDDRKAADIVQINVREISSITDDVIIASATAAPHLRALVDRIGRDVREERGIRPRIVDGTPSSGWMLMDYSSVMVHLLTPEVRAHYNIEGLWQDAPRVETLAKILMLQNKSRLAGEARIAAAAARTSVRPKADEKAKTKSTSTKKTPAKKSTKATSKTGAKAPAKKATTATKKKAATTGKVVVKKITKE